MGVWGLAARKLIKSKAGGKDTWLYFGYRQWWGWVGREMDFYPKPGSRSLTIGVRAFTDREGGFMRQHHSQLWQSSWNGSSVVCPASSFLSRVQLILSSWRRAWQPTAVFSPGESHRQRRLPDYSPWGCKESDRTAVTAHIIWAWWAKIHGAAKESDTI